ncbi:hypothetical protein Tco_1497951 [Tanacetum coccineum]
MHLFEGVIHMQKWAMPVACHMFTYMLKDSARIWWNGQKTVHNIKQKEGESTRAFVTMYTEDTMQILGLHEEQRISGFVHGLRTRSLVEFLTLGSKQKKSTNGTPIDHQESSNKFKRNSSWDNNKGRKNIGILYPYQGPNHGLLSNLSKSPREILATEKENGREWKKGDRGTTLTKAPVLMISRRNDTPKRKSTEESTHGLGKITFPPVSGNDNSTDPVIIKAKISGRQVNRVYMDSGSSCERTLLASRISTFGNYDRGRAIKFHTPEGVGTVLLTYEPNKTGEGQKNLKEASQEDTKDTLSYMSAEEEIIVNNEYPDQTVVIGRQLPIGFKKGLRDFLKANADIFAWTYADMTGIPRTIMVGGKPFIT